MKITTTIPDFFFTNMKGIFAVFPIMSCMTETLKMMIPVLQHNLLMMLLREEILLKVARVTPQVVLENLMTDTIVRNIGISVKRIWMILTKYIMTRLT